MCNGQGSRVEGAPLPAMVQGQFVVHSPGTKLSDAILSKTKNTNQKSSRTCVCNSSVFCVSRGVCVRAGATEAELAGNAESIARYAIQCRLWCRAHLFLSFPYVCSEPVLVKTIILV
jgi:hypothetical protein